ncbi:MAG: adenylosuccinate synthetase [Satyrvirus sp.]|uniref:Adenylosuccinate synthetase n=1 Tax=Satyrvirus sp. TaxID=2487771 RepID=A0A3G5AJN6_9VIRU|nr:MAG: adenylosuccinate synthetase [Satyrvirus sp.]
MDLGFKKTFQENIANWNLYTLVGAAWGDEGKGKIAFSLLEMLSGISVQKETFQNVENFRSNPESYLHLHLHLHKTEKLLLCVRFNGGSNAGHTNIIPGVDCGDGDGAIKTVQIPSGMIVPGVVCMIGPECLVNYALLKEEIEKLERLGVSDVRKRLIIARNAHVVTQEHIQQDIDSERNLQKIGKGIGTTRQGIGPCVAGKATRSNKRVEDFPEFQEMGIVMDTMEFFRSKEKIRMDIVFEGAQAVELDINSGKYPYVTSSVTWPYAIYSTGVYQNVKEQTVIFVLKAYETYVGDAKFQPDGEVFKRIGDVGKEFGTRTKRRRQVNYLDISRIKNTIKHATPANGSVVVVINKYDVLEEVSKEFPGKTFAVIENGQNIYFQTFKEMEEYIVKNVWILWNS